MWVSSLSSAMGGDKDKSWQVAILAATKQEEDIVTVLKAIIRFGYSAIQTVHNT